VQVSELFVSSGDNSTYSFWERLQCAAGALKKITMGRGDKKTKKGKIFKGSFGKSRPAKAGKKSLPAATTVAGTVAAAPAKGK
jgi:30S ribosomal protein S31